MALAAKDADAFLVLEDLVAKERLASSRETNRAVSAQRGER